MVIFGLVWIYQPLCLVNLTKYFGNKSIVKIFLFVDIALEREVEGDLILSDMGQGCPFRAGSFDGAISISALQWLCNADKKSHKPVQRLYKFFSTLYACLVGTLFDVEIYKLKHAIEFLEPNC